LSSFAQPNSKEKDTAMNYSSRLTFLLASLAYTKLPAALTHSAAKQPPLDDLVSATAAVAKTASQPSSPWHKVWA
jgi:hypothetical protein